MARKVTYTSRLGGLVANMGRSSSSRRYHVISSSKKPGWKVVGENNLRTIRKFSSRASAVSFARRHGQPKSIEMVIVHGRDGSVKEVIEI